MGVVLAAGSTTAGSTTAGLAAERLAAEKLAAEKLAAEKLAAEKIGPLVRRLRDGLEERPAVVSSGYRAIDSLLPDGGVRRGSLVEWLLPGVEAASGGITLACAVAVRGLHASANGPGASRRVVIVVDRQGRFHPPAVFPWMGLYPLTGGREYRCDRSGCRLVVVRPSTDDDETWAIDQSLRCSGVKAVVAWPRRIHPTAMRRWQLAARSSGSVGLIARPVVDRREPSWAHVRLVVSPVAGGGAGVRVFRLSTVAGPIDFGERSAMIAIDAAAIEVGGVPEMTKQARERVQCHAS